MRSNTLTTTAANAPCQRHLNLARYICWSSTGIYIYLLMDGMANSGRICQRLLQYRLIVTTISIPTPRNNTKQITTTELVVILYVQEREPKAPQQPSPSQHIFSCRAVCATRSPSLRGYIGRYLSIARFLEQSKNNETIIITTVKQEALSVAREKKKRSMRSTSYPRRQPRQVLVIEMCVW